MFFVGKFLFGPISQTNPQYQCQRNIKMFKKRTQVKTVDLQKDAESIVVEEVKKQQNIEQKSETIPNIKSGIQNKKINTFSMKQPKSSEQTALKTDSELKIQMGLAPQPNQKYGLIDKNVQQPPKAQNNLVMDMYVKQKLKEYTKKQQPVVSVKMQTASEIHRMERKYLEPTEQRIASYDVVEIQKKLQAMSNQLIKSEQEKRTQYLKNLLENQLERIEYASKRELKMIRQQKQRDQKYLNANYSKEGRRHQINKLKNQAFNDFVNGRN